MVKVWLGQKYYTSQVASSLTRLGFKLMTSRSWQYISCHWDACSSGLAISDFETRKKPERRNVNILCCVTVMRTFVTLRTAQLHAPLHKKATIHQVTTMLATSKNVLFPGHNHLLTTGTDDPTLVVAWAKGHQYQWSVGGYDLEIGHF